VQSPDFESRAGCGQHRRESSEFLQRIDDGEQLWERHGAR
jgi:hypothetical protein